MLKSLFLSVVLLVAYATHANAQCQSSTTTDDVTLQTSTAVLCSSFTRGSATAFFYCDSSGNANADFNTDDFVNSGGDYTSVTYRGDAQEFPNSVSMLAYGDGTQFGSIGNGQDALNVGRSFLSSSTVFVRYTDYRRASTTVEIPASGFTEAIGSLPCFEPLLTETVTSTDVAEAPAEPSIATIESTSLCTNTCQYAGDSECDDGGSGSLYALCSLGSDCTDCGPRTH